jgi:hypothetical protein
MIDALIFAIFGWVALAAAAKPVPTGFLERTLLVGARALRYQVYVFNSPDLWDWLLQQERTKPSVPARP